MISAVTVTANLAGLLYLARHRAEGKPELEEAARVFMAVLEGAPLKIVASPACLTVNGIRVPSDAPGASAVNEQFLAHRVSRLELRTPPEVGELLTLVRVLSAYPGVHATWDDVRTALGPVAAKGYLAEDRSELTVIHQDEDSALDLRFGSSEEWASDGLFVEQGGLIPPAVSLSAPDLTRTNVDPPLKREDPAKLERLKARGHSAIEAEDWDSLLTTAQDFMVAEEEAVSELSIRLYRLELRRLLSTREITEIARLAAVGSRRSEAVSVLSRLGGDATEVLMDLLSETEALAERRGYYSALTKMTEGIEVIIHHLDSPMWFVVRNAAELCGEMRLEGSVPELARHLDHADERVRRSIAAALHKIGTRDALEPLARMLKDPAQSVRMQVVGNLDGVRGRALAMPLMSLLQRELDGDVIREVLNALGRIGTPDALMALRSVAIGELKRFDHKQRLQATEALGLAGPAAHQILQDLSGSRDHELAGTAARLLEEVTT